ncbi:MAG: hypothetical protein COA84_14855 [Robiginitomaculum sp.]|nr:MAG: hypothetical protein COA84_14855 [Robiginitomaculum sp.]
MGQYFYSYQGYIGGVKAMCGHNVKELNNDPDKAAIEAVQAVRNSNDNQSIDVHLLALNKINGDK